MKVTIHLPDDIAQRVQARWQGVPRHVLESFVLEGFRARMMTTEDVGRLLGFETKFALVQAMLARDAARKRPM